LSSARAFSFLIDRGFGEVFSGFLDGYGVSARKETCYLPGYTDEGEELDAGVRFGAVDIQNWSIVPLNSQGDKFAKPSKTSF
jgi:hypothetical protein